MPGPAIAMVSKRESFSVITTQEYKVPSVSEGTGRPLRWVDSHCHLDSLDDPGAAVERARAAGVEGIVAVGTDPESSRASVELARTLDGVWATVGLHPHEASRLTPELMEEIEDLAAFDKVVAVGEIGLDYYRDHSPPDAQKEAFVSQIRLAKKLGLPIVVHVRDSHQDVFGLLEEQGPPKAVVFHCFSGGPVEAERALGLRGYVSFAGNISFPRSESLREAARVVPPDRLLVETDSPYLAPVPHRGKPNEPGFVGDVGAALASALGRRAAEIAHATWENARRVFGVQV